MCNGPTAPQEIHTCDGDAIKRITVRSEGKLRAIQIRTEVALQRQPEARHKCRGLFRPQAERPNCFVPSRAPSRTTSSMNRVRAIAEITRAGRCVTPVSSAR